MWGTACPCVNRFLLIIVFTWCTLRFPINLSYSFFESYGNCGFFCDLQSLTADGVLLVSLQGELVVDGEPVPETLMDLVKDTLRANPNNSVIGFKDNSRYLSGALISHALV